MMWGRICSRNCPLDGNLETSILGHLISGVRRKIRLNSDEVLLQFKARSARSILWLAPCTIPVLNRGISWIDPLILPIDARVGDAPRGQGGARSRLTGRQPSTSPALRPSRFESVLHRNRKYAMAGPRVPRHQAAGAQHPHFNPSPWFNSVLSLFKIIADGMPLACISFLKLPAFCKYSIGTYKSSAICDVYAWCWSCGPILYNWWSWFLLFWSWWSPHMVQFMSLVLTLA